MKKAGVLAEYFPFQLWVSNHPLCDETTYKDAAEFIRQRCGVKSRSELKTDEAARKRFYMLVDQYEREMGLQAELRS